MEEKDLLKRLKFDSCKCSHCDPNHQSKALKGYIESRGKKKKKAEEDDDLS